MRMLRACLAGGLLALTAYSAQAEPAWQEVVEPVTEPPAVLADLPFYAGIEGNDEVHGTVIGMMVRDAVRARDFDTLNAMESYFRTASSRLPGGTWELSSFYGGVQQALEGRRYADSPCTLKGMDFAEAWAAHDPDAPAPYIAKASLLTSYGWCVRGGKYAIEVPPGAMLTFRQNIYAAYETLLDHADVASRDPEFYALRIKLNTAQANEGEAFKGLLEEASGRFPYYYPIYFEAAWHETPQWAGSYQKVEAVARYAAERTRERDGDSAYVRVIWSFMECGCDPDHLPIDRALLAQSMDDMFERYPSDWNAAHMAWIACGLGERHLAAEQFARREHDDAMNWDDPADWQRCRTLAGLPEPAIASR